MEKKKLLIFDFDGVIIDTLQLWFGINKEMNPGMTFEDYSSLSHGNFYEKIKSNDLKDPFIPNPNAREIFHEKVRDFDTPEPIQSLIKKFSQEYYLAVVSSGSEESISHFLAKEDLLKYFDHILGYQTHKSKVIKLQQLLNHHFISPAHSVFVTDTLGDIFEAHEVGIKSIGVLWGLHDRETLEKGNPEIIIDDPALLEETIKNILE